MSAVSVRVHGRGALTDFYKLVMQQNNNEKQLTYTYNISHRLSDLLVRVGELLRFFWTLLHLVSRPMSTIGRMWAGDIM